MTLRTFTLLTLLAAVSVAPASAATSERPKSEDWPVPEGLQEYAVMRVIDGDTIEVEKLGTVRYIGVDTPEFTRRSR
ncbi:MAG: hypothetical protein AB1700_11470 [Bacillota bacterium]